VGHIGENVFKERKEFINYLQISKVLLKGELCPVGKGNQSEKKEKSRSLS